MSSFYELGVVHHPEAAKVVLIADKALVHGQVGADGILHVADRRRSAQKECAEEIKRKRERRIS